MALELDADDTLHGTLPLPVLPAPTAPVDSTARKWTREPVDASGIAAYSIMVRAPGDPERRTREDRHEAMGVKAAAGEWKEIRKASVEVWAERFAALLADGRAATLNALTVELDAAGRMVRLRVGGFWADCGHSHGTRAEAEACPWEPAQPPSTYAGIVRQVRDERDAAQGRLL